LFLFCLFFVLVVMYQTEDITPGTSDTAAPAPGAPVAQAYNEKEAKKNLHMAFFIILCVVAGLAGFASFLNFCVSLSQVTSSTEMANGTSIFKSENYSCDDFKKFWPLRWEMAAQRDVPMYCPWPKGNSAFRCLMSLVGLGAVGFFIFVLTKPEARLLNWSFFGVAAFVLVMFFIITIVDGSSLSRGNGFCKDGMPEATALMKPSLKVNGTFGIECFPESFTGLVFCDVFTMLSFPALAAYFFFYHRRSHKMGEAQIPQDVEERQPLAAPPKKKKMFTASTIQDESLTQDVTGENPFDPKTGMVDPNA